MTTSGTYAFEVSNSDAVLSAFARINMRRTQLLAEHLLDAQREANFLLGEWSNKQPNLWTSETKTQVLTAGTATYTLEAKDIMILAAYIRTGTSGVDQVDRIISPVSTVEYASYPNKEADGFPTVYWFNRQIIPQITLWSVPDNTQTYTLIMQVVQQLQDINLGSNETPEIPYRWIDCFIAGLAYRLARIYKPELEAIRKSDYAEAWSVAAVQDTENVSMFISPGFTGYYP